jgi:hypothetical protein
MSGPAPGTQDAALAADAALEAAVLRAERRLRLLEEVSDITMELLRALRPGAVAAAAPAGDPGRDPAESCARLSRALRLTFVLEAKTDQELRALKAGVVLQCEQAAKRAYHAGQARREKVEDLVADVIAAEAETSEIYCDLREALTERLEWDAAYTFCERRPLEETVARLCHDLGLPFDRDRWNGEGWTDDGPPARARCSDFHNPSPTPLLDENLEPLAGRPEPAAHALE